MSKKEPSQIESTVIKKALGSLGKVIEEITEKGRQAPKNLRIDADSLDKEALNNLSKLHKKGYDPISQLDIDCKRSDISIGELRFSEQSTKRSAEVDDFIAGVRGQPKNNISKKVGGKEAIVIGRILNEHQYSQDYLSLPVHLAMDRFNAIKDSLSFESSLSPIITIRGRAQHSFNKLSHDNLIYTQKITGLECTILSDINLSFPYGLVATIKAQSDPVSNTYNTVLLSSPILLNIQTRPEGRQNSLFIEVQEKEQEDIFINFTQSLFDSKVPLEDSKRLLETLIINEALRENPGIKAQLSQIEEIDNYIKHLGGCEDIDKCSKIIERRGDEDAIEKFNVMQQTKSILLGSNHWVSFLKKPGSSLIEEDWRYNTKLNQARSIIEGTPNDIASSRSVLAGEFLRENERILNKEREPAGLAILNRIRALFRQAINPVEKFLYKKPLYSKENKTFIFNENTHSGKAANSILGSIEQWH